MKTLQESIIGRKGSQYFRGKRLSNPKITDLRHLDVLKTRNGWYYICLDYKQCSPGVQHQIIKRVNLEAYTMPEGGQPGTIWCLGLHQEYDMDLRIPDCPEDDIVEVYRGVLNTANYERFRDLWDDLKNKMKI